MRHWLDICKPTQFTRVLCFAAVFGLLAVATGMLLAGCTGNSERYSTAVNPGGTLSLDGAVVTSTVSRSCLQVIPDRRKVRSAEDRVLLLYEGTPETAHLLLASCGVNEGRHHTIYVNGQAIGNVADDAYRTCICEGGVRSQVYTLPDASVIEKGWNHISVTNDADVADSWIAYDAQLAINGEVTGAIKSEFAFTSSYDGSIRRAAYKLPAGYNPDLAVPLLVSIGGSGEDRWDALYHYAERANAAGWLLVAADVRRVSKDWGGRTASLATQHDVIDAIDYMVKNFAVDVERIYMSGFSAGGGVAATVAAKYPHVFAAVVDWIGPTDLLEWAQQRPELYPSLVANDFGCPPGEDEAACPFEWQRRSARFLVMNLKHVPMAIVHGRADDVVPFAQSEDFYMAMQQFYDPQAHQKVAVWHDGGHFDPVPSLRPLVFLERYRLNATPQDIMIRTDESKDYYWMHVVQRDWKGQRRDGFTSVVATLDSHAGVISVTVQDQRLVEGGNLPVDVTIDLARIGFDPADTYVIEHLNLATGTWAIDEVMPVDGHLLLIAPRDTSGKVNHRYEVHVLGSRNGEQ